MPAENASPRARSVLFVLFSAAAGFLNGLLGTGGGMLLVFSLTKLLSPAHKKEVFVISSVGVFCFSLVSSAFYGGGGNLDFARLPALALSGAVGGVLGALLFDRIGVFWLRKIFALLLLYSGLKLAGVLG